MSDTKCYYICFLLLAFLTFAIASWSKKSPVQHESKNYYETYNSSDAVVRFHIFTLKKGQQSFEIRLNKSKELNSTGPRFLGDICDVKTSKFKLITHGFAETWNMTYRWDWVKEFKDEMLKTPYEESSRLCVVAVDWRELARGGDVGNYWKAIKNMEIAAELMSKYLFNNGVNEKNVHCIGFSLGAHMCSILYKRYYQLYNVKLERITGLDPAGPFYADKPWSEKLYHEDANFVDVIHTSNFFGVYKGSGHMDFYPENISCHSVPFEKEENVILYEDDVTSKKNATTYEEIYITDKELNESGGVLSLTINKLKSKAVNLFKKIKGFFSSKPKRVFLTVHQFFGCSHLLSVRYFLYSINNCVFESIYCNSLEDFKNSKCPVMTNKNLKMPRLGYYADLSDPEFKKSYGRFYLLAKPRAPYCFDPTIAYLKSSKHL